MQFEQKFAKENKFFLKQNTMQIEEKKTYIYI